jgi:AmiR/NasT family two-component response regulator
MWRLERKNEIPATEPGGIAVIAMTNKILLIKDGSSDPHDLIEAMSELDYRDIRLLHRTSDIYYPARDYSPDMIIVDVNSPDASLLESVSAINRSRVDSSGELLEMNEDR